VRLLALLALGGCILTEPEVGARLAGTCDNDDSDPATPVLFSVQIRPLVNRSMGGCTCHVPSASGPGIGTQLSGLDMGTIPVLRGGGNLSGPAIVVEGQPCESVLVQKLTEAPPFGSRMPLSGPPFFTADETRLVHDWIAEGALEN
jgi:hypothetical protein